MTHRAVKYDGGPEGHEIPFPFAYAMEYEYIVCGPSLRTYDYVTQKSRRSKQKPAFPLAERGCGLPSRQGRQTPRCQVPCNTQVEVLRATKGCAVLCR